MMDAIAFTRMEMSEDFHLQYKMELVMHLGKQIKFQLQFIIEITMRNCHSTCGDSKTSCRENIESLKRRQMNKRIKIQSE